MDNELKNKIRAKLNITVQAVQGMMQPDVDDEEKQGWIAIYNGAMRKVMNDYLAEDEDDQRKLSPFGVEGLRAGSSDSQLF